MTRDELIRIAREVGIEFYTHTGIGGRTNISSNGSKSIQVFERFAELVAAAEREECAKLCGAYWESLEEIGEDDYQTGRARAAVDLQNAITARSQPTKGEYQK